jgi:septum formation protein
MVNGRSHNVQLFLASNSPRRKELMALGGWQFTILIPQVDETPVPGEDGMEYVLRLAHSKVTSAASQVHTGCVIVAADTTVQDTQADGTSAILGKPCSHAEAVEMLKTLRGRTHQVHTAIAILSNQDGRLQCDLCTTDVPMREYTDEEIEAYVAGGDPMDKAGAYAIQHEGFHPVERLAGCFANVMGLPLCHLVRSLKEFDVQPATHIAQACQAAIGYDCPVYASILDGKIPDYTCR